MTPAAKPEPIRPMPTVRIGGRLPRLHVRRTRSGLDNWTWILCRKVPYRPTARGWATAGDPIVYRALYTAEDIRRAQRRDNQLCSAV